MDNFQFHLLQKQPFSQAQYNRLSPLTHALVEYIQFTTFNCLLVLFPQSNRMRVSAAVSIILCVVALILSFLCLFAGSSKGFMEDYAIITVSLRELTSFATESFDNVMGSSIPHESARTLCKKSRRSSVTSDRTTNEANHLAHQRNTREA